MRSIFIIIALLLISASAMFSQSILDKKYSTENIKGIEIEMDYGDVDVTFQDVEEMEIRYDITINGDMDERVIDISDRKSNGILKISSEFDFDYAEQKVTMIGKNGERTIITKEEYEKNKKSYKKFHTINIGYDIDGSISIVLPKNKSINLMTTYGDLNIKHDNLEKRHDLDFHSTYGHIDLSIPEGTASDLELITSYGEIFTNHDFKTDNSKKREDCGFGENIVATLNQNPKGKIALKATYDNIYLRKF